MLRKDRLRAVVDDFLGSEVPMPIGYRGPLPETGAVLYRGVVIWNRVGDVVAIRLHRASPDDGRTLMQFFRATTSHGFVRQGRATLRDHVRAAQMPRLAVCAAEILEASGPLLISLGAIQIAFWIERGRPRFVGVQAMRDAVGQR